MCTLQIAHTLWFVLDASLLLLLFSFFCRCCCCCDCCFCYLSFVVCHLFALTTPLGPCGAHCPALQEYRRLSHQAQALEVLLQLVQEVAERGGGGVGTSPHMGKEDLALLDKLERTKARAKRRISDMANPNFGSIFRYIHMVYDNRIKCCVIMAKL